MLQARPSCDFRATCRLSPPSDEKKMMPLLWKTRWSIVVLLGLVAAVAGCNCCPLAELMVSAPNRFNPLAGPKNPLPPIESLIADQHVWVCVGPPKAWLSVSILDPRGRTPRGTVFVLHGIGARGCTMYSTARDLNRAGYRAVLVDLRGQGRSTGEYITYGVREAQDLVQVLDALEQHGKIAGKAGVYGLSYGATTSIHWAARDPRIRAVVAVEPFAMLRPEVSHFSRTMLPGIGWCIPESCYQEALTQAARRPVSIPTDRTRPMPSQKPPLPFYCSTARTIGLPLSGTASFCGNRLPAAPNWFRSKAAATFRYGGTEIPAFREWLWIGSIVRWRRNATPRGEEITEKWINPRPQRPRVAEPRAASRAPFANRSSLI